MMIFETQLNHVCDTFILAKCAKIDNPAFMCSFKSPGFQTWDHFLPSFKKACYKQLTPYFVTKTNAFLSQ